MHEYMTHDQIVNHDGTTDHITDGELVGTAIKGVSGETDHYDAQHNLDLRSLTTMRAVLIIQIPMGISSPRRFRTTMAEIRSTRPE